MAIDKTLLLNMLINSAPLLMQALSKPYNSPGSWHHGEDPLDDMFRTGENLKMLQDRGYDMGLIQDQMLQRLNEPSFFKRNDTDSAVLAISDVMNSLQDSYDMTVKTPYPNVFPSDIAGIRYGIDDGVINNIDDIVKGASNISSNIDVDLGNLIPDFKDAPALKSAFAMLRKKP